MYIGKWDNSDVGDKITRSIDFGSKRLASGETILSVTWTVTLLSGTDSTPASRISGTSTISSNNIVSQLFDFTDSSLSGNLYRLNCAATTSTGQIINAYGHQNIVAQT